MTTDNKDNKLSIGSGDYAEILRHAVAVIEHARTEIAQHVNGYVSTAYWEIGQMLHERKIESGYGDSVVKRLSADLKERYPKMGVSPRQLWNMKKFYECKFRSPGTVHFGVTVPLISVVGFFISL